MIKAIDYPGGGSARKSFFAIIVAFGVIMSNIFCRPSPGEEEDHRIQQAREELRVLAEIAKSVTNTTERANWDKRVRLAEKSLLHVRRLVALEEIRAQRPALALLDVGMPGLRRSVTSWKWLIASWRRRISAWPSWTKSRPPSST